MRRNKDADELRADRIEPHILDITKEADIAAIAQRVAHDPDRRRLRALVNNAGIAPSTRPSRCCPWLNGTGSSTSICSDTSP